MRSKTTLKGKKKAKWHRIDDVSVRAPEGVKHFWVVATCIYKDVEPFLPRDVSTDFATLLRSRDLTAYDNFCESYSLQQIKYQEWEIHELRATRFLTSLQKYLPPGDKQSRVDSAVKRFFKAEEICRKTNLRGPISEMVNHDIVHEEVFTHAKHFIKSVLGPVDINEICLLSRSGPGADVGTTKQRTHLFDKLCDPPYSVTADALPLATFLVITDPRWLRSLLAQFYRDPRIALSGYQDSEVPIKILSSMSEETYDEFMGSIFTIVEGNVILTVDKNKSTDRDIAKEPRMNLFLQLGVDAVIRRNLKAFGINLDSQTKNQNLAISGSKNNDLVTLDLWMASGLISTQTIRDYFPPEWAKILFLLRSSCGHIKLKKWGHDVKVNYEKICSMGNGYCFAVQSLLYASLVYGVVRSHGKLWREILPRISVFGDDIICPREIAGDVVFALHRTGLKVNTDKSFFNGFVRESCGTDCYKGIDIRPRYIPGPPADVQEAVIQHNLLYDRYYEWFGIAPVHIVRMRDWIPEKYRFTGPVMFDHVASWLFEVNLPESRVGHDKHYHQKVYKLRRLRFARSSAKRPFWKRYFFLNLLFWNVGSGGQTEKFDLWDRFENDGRLFDVIGRDCNIQPSWGSCEIPFHG